MEIPRRIVRFYASADDAKSSYDDSKSYYGILEDNQEATVGTTVSLLDYGNIYDTSRYECIIHWPYKIHTKSIIHAQIKNKTAIN